MHHGKLYIAGDPIVGKGEEIVSENPATGAVIWRGPGATLVQVDEAFAAAKSAFEVWRKTPLEKRIEVLKKYSRLIDENKDRLAEIISAETGKVLWDATGEVAAVIRKAEISIRAYEERTPTRVKEGDPLRTRLTHKPHGVMGVIGPYNFPCHLANGHIVPALLAGNTVVFKPSSWTPFSGEAMVEFWHRAGLPEGAVNLVQGGGEVGRSMVGHKDLKGLLFTGGVPTGQAIARSLAERLDVIMALELGGNNPLIVWDAEDLEAAAIITIQSAFISAGQRCTCARRLIVPDSDYGKTFIKRLTAAMPSIEVGMPDGNPQPFMGSLITADAAEDVLKRQAYLEKKGGKVLARTERLSLGAAFVKPGLIDVTDIKERDDVECFGPLLQVIRVKDFDAAIKEANNTAFGLSAGILTDDKTLYERFYGDINAGVVNWNQMLPGASSDAPFGGIGLSGNHRPSAYYAADYAAWPMASLEASADKLTKPALPKGLKI